MGSRSQEKRRGLRRGARGAGAAGLVGRKGKEPWRCLDAQGTRKPCVGEGTALLQMGNRRPFRFRSARGLYFLKKNKMEHSTHNSRTNVTKKKKKIRRKGI